MKKMLYMLSVLLFLSTTQIANAQEWIKIAEKTVSFKSDKDVIEPKGDEKDVTKIRIKCTEGTLKLKKVSVKMSDGTERDYDAKLVPILTKGMTSVSWDLPGHGSDVRLKKIELHYDTMGNVLVSKRAKVEIQGKEDRD